MVVHVMPLKGHAISVDTQGQGHCVAFACGIESAALLD